MSEHIYVLRDIDNRDGDEPFETTGTIKQLAAYVDGPLRRDLTELSDLDIDLVVSEMREGRLSRWHVRDLESCNIYIREAKHEREGVIEWGVRINTGDDVQVLRCSSEEQARAASGQYEGVVVSREVVAGEWAAAHEAVAA